MEEDAEKIELAEELEKTKAELEELKRAKTPPVVKIESPLEREEFEDFLDAFMSATAVQDRRKAILLAARALKNLGADPETHLEEAVKTAQYITGVLNALPDSELAKQTKDLLIAEAAGKVGEAAYREPTSEERMERRMERMMEMMMPWKMAMAMFGGTWGQEGQGKSAEVARLESELATVKEKLAEKPIEELKGIVTRIEAELKAIKEAKPAEEGEGVIRKLEELKSALAGTKESDVVKKLDDLTKALTEKERAKELDELKQTLSDIKNDVAARVASLESSMAEGRPQQDVMKQAGELFNGIGNLYKGFGEMAKSMGYEPKDEKLSGDLKRDIVSLGKKALDVVEKAVKYPRERPPRQAVQQLPLETMRIPIQPAQAQPEVEASAQPEIVDEHGIPVARPFAKRPKPVEIPAEPAKEAAPASPAEAPSEQPEAPVEAPQETEG